MLHVMTDDNSTNNSVTEGGMGSNWIASPLSNVPQQFSALSFP